MGAMLSGISFLFVPRGDLGHAARNLCSLCAMPGKKVMNPILCGATGIGAVIFAVAFPVSIDPILSTPWSSTPLLILLLLCVWLVDAVGSESQSCCDVFVPPAPRQQTTSSPSPMHHITFGVIGFQRHAHRGCSISSPSLLWVMCSA